VWILAIILTIVFRYFQIWSVWTLAVWTLAVYTLPLPYSTWVYLAKKMIEQMTPTTCWGWIRLVCKTLLWILAISLAIVFRYFRTWLSGPWSVLTLAVWILALCTLPLPWVYLAKKMRLYMFGMIKKVKHVLAEKCDDWSIVIFARSGTSPSDEVERRLDPNGYGQRRYRRYLDDAVHNKLQTQLKNKLSSVHNMSVPRGEIDGKKNDICEGVQALVRVFSTGMVDSWTKKLSRCLSTGCLRKCSLNREAILKEYTDTFEKARVDIDEKAAELCTDLVDIASSKWMKFGLDDNDAKVIHIRFTDDDSIDDFVAVLIRDILSKIPTPEMLCQIHRDTVLKFPEVENPTKEKSA